MEQFRLIREQQSPEVIHDFRVATRRLRVCMRLLRRGADLQSDRKLRRTFRSLAQACGDTREWDIALTWANRWIKARKATAEMLEWVRHFEVQRAQEASRFQSVLLGEDPERISAEFTEYISRAGGISPVTLKYFGQTAITERAAGMLEYLNAANDPLATEQLHALRIASKGLRYTLEIFSTCFEIRPWLDSLKKLQDVLGALHDLDVLVADMRRLIKREMRSHVKTTIGQIRIVSRQRELRRPLQDAPRRSRAVVQFARYTIRQRVVAFQKYYKFWHAMKIEDWTHRLNQAVL